MVAPARPVGGGGIKLPFQLRLGIFLCLAALVIGFAAWLLLPQPHYMADHQLQISMSGYNPNRLTIAAGRSTTVELVNSESPFHDGGGLHNFVLPEASISTVIPAKSSLVITLPALAAGTYTFYCDVCCGGKENPAMRATLIVQ
ncbi:MAG: hypothetical protein BGO39_17880 [Chloroflexi bacterium 54-19]|nr:MAG: hypothetical protein BGO39_17880 [Chloroflexi bacterium 54-19]